MIIIVWLYEDDDKNGKAQVFKFVLLFCIYQILQYIVLCLAYIILYILVCKI